MIAVYVFVMAGVRDESPHINGLSHLCEHLVFGGTDRWSQKEIFHKITEIGGYFNAFTRRDYTLFLALFPGDSVMDGMEILSSMLFKSKMTREDLDREKFVISQEIRENSLRDEFIPTQLFYNELFQGSPYSLPVLGTQETMSRISLEDVTNFYHENYVPSNMKILLLGDLEEKKAERYINYFFSERYPQFRSIKMLKGNDFQPPSPPLKLLQKPSLLLNEADVQKNYLFLAMESPGTDSPQFLPFLLFSELIFTGGRLSLENRLRSCMQRHFLELHITYLFWKDRGLLMFRILNSPGFLPVEAMDMFFRQFDEIVSNPIPEEDLIEYLVTEEASRLYGGEKIDSYGLLESQSYINMKFEKFANFLEDLKKITPEEISKAAKEMVKRGEWCCMGIG